MPRVVPSEVVRAMDQAFPHMTLRPNEFHGLQNEQIPAMAGLIDLIGSIPDELVLLPPERYTALTANLAYLRAVTIQYRGTVGTPGLQLTGFTHNPVAIIREALANCPDEAPSSSTTALAF